MTRRRLDTLALIACAALAIGCAVASWWIPARDAEDFAAERARATRDGPPPPPPARSGGVNRRLMDP